MSHGVDALMPLSEACRLLGVPVKTALDRLRRSAAPELEARWMFGRWKVPVRVVKQLAAEGMPRPAPAPASTRTDVQAIFDRVDFPHLQRGRGRKVAR